MRSVVSKIHSKPRAIVFPTGKVTLAGLSYSDVQQLLDILDVCLKNTVLGYESLISLYEDSESLDRGINETERLRWIVRELAKQMNSTPEEVDKPLKQRLLEKRINSREKILSGIRKVVDLALWG